MVLYAYKYSSIRNQGKKINSENQCSISLIRNWQDSYKLTYSQIMKLVGTSHSGLARLFNGRIKLPYNIYIRLKELKVL